MIKKNYFITLIVASLFLVTCSKNDNPTGPNYDYKGQSTGTFDATFTEQTIYFDLTEIDDIISIDTVNQIYKFKKTSVKANEIAKDKILLIHGTALRKVTEVTNSGNEIIVETDDATLDEAIKDGTIEWTTYCDFNPETQLQIEIGKKVYQPTFQSGNKVSFSINLGDGYEYAITMELNKTSANVKMSVTKKINSAVKATFAADGTISSFSSFNKIQYANSKLVNYTNDNKNLKGDLTLSATVAGSGNASINKEIPFVIISIPYTVGPIPVFIRIKLQLVINVVVPIDGSAQASINFKYDSETGLTYNGLNVEPKMRIGNYTITKNKSEVGASSAIAVNYGIGFPRLELGIFDKVIVPWVQTAFLISNDYTFYPACKQTRASYIAGCGYNFEFLGIKSSATKNLWQRDTTIDKTGNCP